MNNILNSGSRYSLKKLFTLWLPVAFLISVIISIIYIFNVREVSYSNFSLSGKHALWEVVVIVFFHAIPASNNLIVPIFLCAFAHLLIVEIFSTIRLFKLRKIEGSGGLKMLFRFLVAQATAAAVFLVSFLLIYTVSLGASFLYGYGDLQISLKEATKGNVTSNEEIVTQIQNSSSVIEIYDAAGEFGVVLAKRGLKKKGKLSVYEGVVLPLLVKLIGKDTDGTSFFIPTTNSFVYTNFNKSKTDKIIIELAYNSLSYHDNPAVSLAFAKKEKPTVTYLDDQDYGPYLTKKSEEDNQKNLSECNNVTAFNTKLIAEQERDYLENCIAAVRYSNCAEFGEQLSKNKARSREATRSCQEYKTTTISELQEEFKERELSSGLYFFDTKTIYMRIIPDRDAFLYLLTLLHELLHHYSEAGSELPIFINEGITDYLAYKSFNFSDYEIADSSAYFKETQVFMALLEKIPESELIAAYFANDAAAFKALFKKYFPKADYEIFLSKGNAMYRETFQLSDPTFDLGFSETSIDHPAVRDVRTFLGLEPAKFYQHLY